MEQELINLILSPTPNYMRIREIIRTPEGRGLVNNITIPNTTGTPKLITYLLKEQTIPNSIILDLIVKAGADINSVDNNLGSDRRTPINTCIFNNNIDGLIVLIEAGADLNNLDHRDMSPLMNATKFRKKSIVKELIKGSANVNLENDRGYRALDFANDELMLDIYDILAKAGAIFGSDTRISNKEDSMKKHINIQKEIFEKKLKYIEEGKDLNTPLAIAMENNDYDTFNTLLSHHIFLNLVNVYGTTPLISACVANKLQFVNRLIEAGADINRQNYYGNTALNAASRSSNLNIIETLLTAGADPFIQNKFGDTPLDRAIYFRREGPIIDILKRTMDENTLTTADAYLRNSLDTSGLGPTRNAPLRGISDINEPDRIIEKILNMRYGGDADAGYGRRKKSPRKSRLTKKKCEKSNLKKYRSRPGPPYPAQKCRNKSKRGNNGEVYRSRPNRNGVFTWKKV